jgi:transketolase
MRDAFFRTFFEMAKEEPDLHLFTADLGFGVLTPYLDRFADRVTNVGVAEQNMVGLAAGMALRGMRVACYSMVPFVFFRALDQIRSDLCAMRLPVTLVGVGCGLSYGLEGMTHHAIEDLAIARALPNLTVYTPGDPVECEQLVRAALRTQGPVYLRLGGNNDPVIHREGSKPLPGQITSLADEGDLAIIAVGTMLRRCSDVQRTLAETGRKVRLYSLHTVKPLDVSGLQKIAAECEGILVVEEHSVINGAATAVAEVLMNSGYRGRFERLGLADAYATEFGDRDWMRDRAGLSSENIAEAILSLAP